MISWPEVGALATITVAVCAFFFNYMRRDNTPMSRAQIDIVGILKDVKALHEQHARLERELDEARRRCSETSHQIDGKMEKLTELLIKAMSVRRRDGRFVAEDE